MGKEFEYKDDWGELSTGKRVSRLFVLHVPSNTVKMVLGALRHARILRAPLSLARSRSRACRREHRRRCQSVCV